MYDLPLIARRVLCLRGKMKRKDFSRLAGGFLGCESGAVAVEYVIIAAAMFLALIPSFLYVASGMLAKFSSVGGYFAGL